MGANIVDDSADHITERHDAFFRNIGLCITQWASVEDVLFRLARHALGVDASRAAIVFFRTPNVRGRIELTDELIRLVLPAGKAGHDHPALVKWKKLKSRAEELLEFRNHLAHQPVSGYYANVEVRPGEDEESVDTSATE